MHGMHEVRGSSPLISTNRWLTGQRFFLFTPLFTNTWTLNPFPKSSLFVQMFGILFGQMSCQIEEGSVHERSDDENQVTENQNLNQN